MVRKAQENRQKKRENVIEKIDKNRRKQVTQAELDIIKK